MQAATTSSAAEAHTTSVVVWDVPTSLVVGETFRIKVGVKCSAECRLADARLGIYDHHDARVGSGVLAGEVWPDTTGLYVAEVELRAPGDEGLYTWSVKAPVADAVAPHEERSATFGVRVVSRPEHAVTIEAFDADGRAPLVGARVVMHPYHAVTDERGVARLRVAKGTYRLFVSQTRYVTFGVSVDVTADMTATAELSLEPVLERN
jgi:hypothetical protein